MEKEKKPIFKKWWFWVIIVVVIIAVSGTDNTSNTNSISTSTNSYQENKNANENISSVSSQKSVAVEVNVVDFSTMSKEDIKTWFDTNKIKGTISEEYSDTVPKGTFVSQSVAANTVIHEGDKITITYSLGKEPTLGERNALSKAKDYLAYTSFSHKGLIEQLEYEGFSKEESAYGADNCEADWNEQAAKKAKSYMEYSSFSKSGLIDQLKYEGFTNEQAQYGATAVGY